MSRLSREDWVRAAQKALISHGVDSVRVERLATAIGVSKGSFYWHFKDRPALLQALLADWEQRGTDAVIASVGGSTGATPGERLWQLMERVFGVPAEHDLLETAVRSWAMQDPLAREAVERVDSRRLAYVANLLADAGVPPREAKRRAQLLYCALVGEFFMCSHGAKPLPKSVLQSLHGLMLAKPEAGA